LSAECYGNNVDAARTEALKALASSVFVYIESDSELSEDSSGDFNFSTSTHLSTDLPLMGVEYDCYKSEPPQLCQVSMDTEIATSLYREKVMQLRLILIPHGGVATLSSIAHDTLHATAIRYEKYLTVIVFRLCSRMFRTRITRPSR